jgi:hypothetical protein
MARVHVQGRGEPQDRYYEAQMAEVMRFYLQGRKQSVEPYLRTAVVPLLAHNHLAAERAGHFYPAEGS